MAMTNDKSKTKTQLIEEIHDLRKQVTVLENSLQGYKHLAKESHKAFETTHALKKNSPGEDTFRTIFENIKDEIVYLDRYGKILDVNNRIEDIFGYKREDVIGKNFTKLKFFGLKDLPKMVKIFKDSLISGKSIDYLEMEVKHKDGHEVPVEVSTRFIKKDDKIDGLLCVIRDVSERKSIEIMLRHERDFAQSLVETAQVITLVLDLEGRIVTINPYMETLSGYRLEEVKGKDWFDTFLPEGIHTRIRNLFKTAISDMQTKGNIYPIRTKDGQLHDIEWYDKTLKDAEGNITGLLATGQDVTERLKFERILVDERVYLTIINKVSNILNAKGTLDDATDIIREELHLHGANIGLLDDNNILRVAGASSDLGFLISKAARAVYIDFNKNKEAYIFFKTLHSVKTITFKRLFDLITPKGTFAIKAVQKLIAELTNIAMGQTIIAPLANSKGKKIGALLLSKKTNGVFTEQEISLVSSLCSTLALAIDREQGEERLYESEEKYRASFDNARDAINVFTRNKEIIAVNKALVKLSEYTKEELLAMKLPDLYPDASSVETAKRIQELLDGKEVPIFETYLQAKDGTVIPVEIGVTLLKNSYDEKYVFQGNIRDISQRKKTEATLDERQELLNNVLESMSDGILVLDKEFRYTYWNDAMERISKTPREKVINSNKLPWEIFPHLKETGVDTMIHLAMEGKTGYRKEIPYHLPDGASRFTNELFLPLKSKSGDIIGVVGVIRDITEEKKTKTILLQKEEQLRQTEKLVAIGQLAGGIAHDFNNQLGSIVGFADLIKERVKGDERLTKYANNILITARRSADLTKQMLAFARKGKYKVVPVDIHATIGEVVAILEHSIDKKIKLKQQLQAQPSTTSGDPSQLQSAILNLALNARDAMPEGGEITFNTDIQSLDAAFCNTHHNDINPGDYLQISVIDTGEGIPKKIRQYIFEPFFSTKDMAEKTGMGLAAVYGIIKNHKGVIDVTSKVNSGTTMTIYLPLAEKKDLRETESTPHKVSIRDSAHILLVDDEEMLAEMAHDILVSLGYKVTVCRDGKEALEVYTELWQEIDLILLDIVMPEMDGKETYLAMREINPKVKVLVSSGYSLTGRAREILAQGGHGFLQKPYRKVQLAEKVERILAR